MTQRRHHQPDPAADAVAATAYDWRNFGRHRLRAPNRAIIDFPVATVNAVTVWVATIWPDPRTPGGWARDLWQPDPVGRGWRLPVQLAAGDVIELGADTPHEPVRWYGIMDTYEPGQWATIQGPYEHPSQAFDDAQRLLALERFVEPLSADPPNPVVSANPVRRARLDQRRRHRHSRRRGGTSTI